MHLRLTYHKDSNAIYRVSSDARVSVLCGLSLLALVVWGHPVSGAFSIFIFVTYICYLLVKNPAFIVKYLIFLYSALINIVGTFACETEGLFLTELQCYSGYVGSLPLLVFSRWLFFIILLKFDSVFGCENDSSPTFVSNGNGNDALMKFATIAVGAVYLLLLVGAMRYPAALLAGMDRFAWRTRYDGSSILPSILVANVEYLIIVPLCAFLRGHKKLGIVCVLIYCLYLLWTGEKFGGFFHIACIALWVCYDWLISKGRRFLIRVLVYITVIVVVLMSGAVFIQAGLMGSGSDPITYVSQRSAQQGQLWWKTYEKVGNDFHPEQFEDELDLVGKRAPAAKEAAGLQVGIYRIMYLTAPTNLVDGKLSTGSTYTEAGYAAMYYYFGPIGTLIHSLFSAILIGVFVNTMIRAVRVPWIVDSVLTLRLVIMVNAFLGNFSSGLVARFSLMSILYLVIAKLLRDVYGKSEHASLLSWKMYHSSSDSSISISRWMTSIRA